MQCNYPANPDDGSAHDLIATEVAFDGINTFQCQQRCLANSECKSFQFGAACEIFNKTIAEAHIKHNGSSTNLYFDRDCPQYQYVNYSHSKPVRYKKTDWDDTKPGCPAGDHIKRVPASQTPSELKTLPPNEISSICTCLVASVPTAVTKTIINSLILSAFTTETFTTTALTTVTAYPKNLISWTTSYSLTH
ncbi:uncharacterized protein LY89DRAFT_78510 [Mollisia scopiformis]|uniref:Apple domain-containing protein n=1 Tax=Mollisia scopiformis TaxID=149040 RepID=A0A194X7W7_MOLSC|nr:uncharacterized protein LY89DRAFT_78510 [Mollisia scopiformis]KUJ16261.1 hypothetical protein LY89DRAFT_78510 [Mollisia scopiformis]